MAFLFAGFLRTCEASPFLGVRTWKDVEFGTVACLSAAFSFNWNFIMALVHFKEKQKKWGNRKKAGTVLPALFKGLSFPRVFSVPKPSLFSLVVNVPSHLKENSPA